MEQKIDNLNKSVEEIGKDIKSLDTKYSGKGRKPLALEGV